MVLEALSREREVLLNSEDPQADSLAKELQQLVDQIAGLTLAGPGKHDVEEYQKKLEQLKKQKDAVEQKIARFSQAYRSELASRRVDHAAVAKLLPPQSALVEFVAYCSRNFKAKGEEKKWGDSRYLAFLLFPGDGGKVQVISLGKASVIDQAVAEFRGEIAKSGESIYQLGEPAAESKLSEQSASLYDLVFAPIAEQLGDVKKIYISADGDLNLLPFGVLKDRNGDYLLERYAIHYLSSGRDLVRYKLDVESGKGVAIMASPDYDLNESGNTEFQIAGEDSSSPSFNVAMTMGRGISDLLEDVHWPSLPQTLQEGEQIAGLFKDEQVELFTGAQAVEGNLKRLKRPRILHIATHGFFLEDIDWSKYYESVESRGFQLVSGEDNGLGLKNVSQVDNPLFRSGLVLSGANRHLFGRGIDDVGDGILTAYEISGMDLWGTDLVVLSACETGLGDIRRGEGVFGLRRSFQLAGARTVVMSLWQVPDAETRELMVDFYRRILSGEGKSEALRHAQLSMIKKRRERYGAAHPFYWGAFICVGEE